jgi:predicted metal-dependent phosphotriesterase family hydrolase
MINTVLGPIAPESLGRTLAHEHLVPGTCELAHYAKGRGPASPVEILAQQLSDIRAGGGQTVIDVTGNRQQYYGLLPDLSRRTGVQIVVSTAFYKEPHLPAFFQTQSTDWIADLFVRQFHEGVDGTGIRPGIIGEVGTSMGKILPAEEKLLRAAARAHRSTGLPITTHCTIATMGVEQLDLFESEGVALDQVVIGHCDLTDDLSYHTAITDRGAFVAIDTIGKEHYRYIRFGTQSGLVSREEEYYHRSDESRINLLLELLHRGLAGQLLISMDITAHEAFYNPRTYGEHGYAYLLGPFCQRLRERGVSEDELTQLLVRNPARLLANREVL